MKKEKRKKVYNKFDGHCAYCGCDLPYKKMQVDHFWPQKREHWLQSEPMMEGAHAPKELKDINDIRNLIPACARCNRWKSSMDIETFREQIAAQVERVKRDKAGFRMALDFGLIESTGINVEFYYEKLENLTHHW